MRDEPFAYALLALLKGSKALWVSIALFFALFSFRFKSRGQRLWRGFKLGIREFLEAYSDVRREFSKRTDIAVYEALTTDNITVDVVHPLAPQERRKVSERSIVFVAQGLGAGRIPFAPGTWGSLVGIGWFLLLLLLPSVWWYLAAVVLSIAVAIPVCSEAERLLGQTDPSSVVLDEIVAMPVAFGGYVGVWLVSAQSLPALGELSVWWPVLLAGFVLFRLFDIWKPWPIRKLQRLPGGWGVVVDDLAAAVATAVFLWLGHRALFLFGVFTGEVRIQ